MSEENYYAIKELQEMMKSISKRLLALEKQMKFKNQKWFMHRNMNLTYHLTLLSEVRKIMKDFEEKLKELNKYAEEGIENNQVAFLDLKEKLKEIAEKSTALKQWDKIKEVEQKLDSLMPINNFEIQELKDKDSNLQFQITVERERIDELKPVLRELIEDKIIEGDAESLYEYYEEKEKYENMLKKLGSSEAPKTIEEVYKYCPYLDNICKESLAPNECCKSECRKEFEEIIKPYREKIKKEARQMEEKLCDGCYYQFKHTTNSPCGKCHNHDHYTKEQAASEVNIHEHDCLCETCKQQYYEEGRDAERKELIAEIIEDLEYLEVEEIQEDLPIGDYDNSSSRVIYEEDIKKLIKKYKKLREARQKRICLKMILIREYRKKR